MATFKVLLDKRRQLNDGTYPLAVRIFNGRNFRDVKLKVRLKEDEFDEKTQRAVRHPNRKEINQKIIQTLIQLQEATLKFELADEYTTAQKIKTGVVKPSVKLDFLQYGEKIAKEMQDVGRLGNAAAYRAALLALKTYTGRSNLQFQDVNYELLVAFENKMLTAGLKKNSIAAYHRSIRAVFNRAVNADLVDLKYYPYRKYKIKGEGTAKRNISKSEIAAIDKLILKHGSSIWNARNYFLLSFNFRGMSFADMATIKPSDISKGRLIYKRKKTHKVYNVKLTSKATEILGYYQQPGRMYVLPIIRAEIAPNSERERVYIQQAIKNCNKQLKKLGEAVNLDDVLTTYFSRHSWATIAKKSLLRSIMSTILDRPTSIRCTDSVGNDVVSSDLMYPNLWKNTRGK
jgi:site-specific recombinase XerD